MLLALMRIGKSGLLFLLYWPLILATTKRAVPTCNLHFPRLLATSGLS